MRDREAHLKSQLALACAELALERRRVNELRESGELSAAEASTARGQVVSLQASLDRLVHLMEGKGQRSPKGPRKSGVKPAQVAGS